jgi:glucose-6-phosphate 1-epimerase
MISDADQDRFPAPLIIRSPRGARAMVSPHGAQALSWQTPDGEERLFLSRRADYRESAAIRGGVPVIFPQFAGEGPLPKHGFARTARWSPVSQEADRIRLRLTKREVSHALWDLSYRAEVTVSVTDEGLQIELEVENRDTRLFAFTAALHTYLRVDAVQDVAIHGLNGLRYRDSACGGVESVESAKELRIEGEVDRIYFNAPSSIELHQPKHRLNISSRGFADAVVWNPGAGKAAQLADLEEEGWRHFVCIEAAAIGTPVQLAPGEIWSGMQAFSPA